MKDFYSQQNSDSLLFMLLVLIDAYTTPVSFAWQILNSAATMMAKCMQSAQVCLPGVPSRKLTCTPL